jgi:hypothetical protein
VTALLYLAIIALWVIFLVPWLIRRRDTTTGRRSADRYHRAMAVLSRRHHGPDEIVPVAEHEDEAVTEAYVDTYRDPWGATLQRSLGSLGSWVPLGGSRAGGGSTASVRRRRVLMVLGALCIGALGGAGLGVLPVAVAVAALGALGGYLVLLASTGRGRLAAAGAGLDAADLRARTRAAQAQADGMLAARGGVASPRAEAGRHESGGLWEPVATSLPGKVVHPGADGARNGPDMVERAHQQRREAQARAQARFEQDMAALRPEQEVVEAQIAELASFEEPVRREVRRAANQ